MLGENVEVTDLTQQNHHDKYKGDGHLDQALTRGQDTVGVNNIQPPLQDGADKGGGTNDAK